MKHHLLRAIGITAALLAAVAACTPRPEPMPDYVVPPATPAAAATSTPGPSVGTKILVADALTIADTGVRCFVGHISLACTSSARPMRIGDARLWTTTLSRVVPNSLEPGFEPGKPVGTAAVAVGDVGLVGGQLGVISQVVGNLMVRVDNREIAAADVANGRHDFGGWFHPDEGERLARGQVLTIRDWTFALAGHTLTITSPNGPTEIDI